MTLLGWALVAVAAMSVGATLLTRGTVALMGRFGGEAVQRVMRDTEYVVEHHAVPPAWKARLERRLGDLRTDSLDSPPGERSRGRAEQERRRARARRWCLRALDRLVTFAKKSSVVANEETRGILLAELAQVREEWLARSWDEMCRQGAGHRTAAVAPGPRE